MSDTFQSFEVRQLEFMGESEWKWRPIYMKAQQLLMFEGFV